MHLRPQSNLLVCAIGLKDDVIVRRPIHQLVHVGVLAGKTAVDDAHAVGCIR
jgi:hypothetical protein